MSLADAPLDWPTWLASINLLQVAVVVCALYVIVRLLVKFWPWLRKLMAFTDAQTKLPAFIERTDKALAEQAKILAAQNEKIAEIHHEVNYNNGSSVKDAITRAENGVERTELGVKSLSDRMDVAGFPAAPTAPLLAIEPKEKQHGNENDSEH